MNKKAFQFKIVFISFALLLMLLFALYLLYSDIKEQIESCKKVDGEFDNFQCYKEINGEWFSGEGKNIEGKYVFVRGAGG